MTRQPLSAKSEIAIEPTPPAAPVTSAGPADGVEVVALDRHQRQHGGEAGGADRHRFGPGEAGRQLDQPVAVHPRSFGIAAEMGLAEPIAGQHDLVAGREVRAARTLDDSGEIDAEHHGKPADDRRFAAERQPVLVIDGRMGDADRHVAVHELGLVHVDEAGRPVRRRSCRLERRETSWPHALELASERGEVYERDSGPVKWLGPRMLRREGR